MPRWNNIFYCVVLLHHTSDSWIEQRARERFDDGSNTHVWKLENGKEIRLVVIASTIIIFVRRFDSIHWIKEKVGVCIYKETDR